MERHVQTVESFKFVGDNFRGLLLICGDEIKELFFQYYEEVKYGRGDQQQYLIKEWFPIIYNYIISAILALILKIVLMELIGLYVTKSIRIVLSQTKTLEIVNIPKSVYLTV